jgi:hypothetical protein
MKKELKRELRDAILVARASVTRILAEAEARKSPLKA